MNYKPMTDPRFVIADILIAVPLPYRVLAHPANILSVYNEQQSIAPMNLLALLETNHTN